FSRPASEPVTVYASEGEPASLSLPLFPSSSGTPGLDCGWLRQDSDGSSHSLQGPGVEIDEAGLRLTIGTVRPEDRGLYTGFLSLGGATLRRTVRLELIRVRSSTEGPVSLGSSLRLEVINSGPDTFDGLSCRHENASGAEESTPAPGQGAFLIPHVRPSDAGLWTCEVWQRGRAVGSITYSLDMTELAKQGSLGPGPQSDRATIAYAFLGFPLLIVAVVCVILARWKCCRRHFPALEVTLTSGELPPKKV
ncbi:uncharacterized protein LOC132390245, partial [Hypanus sabinus]|uniref:uncharacterized protein LOC132390245 n=1 Tax=Hypanus sabinus TaxID=79690 RepID=UPI0028C3B813